MCKPWRLLLIASLLLGGAAASAGELREQTQLVGGLPSGLRWYRNAPEPVFFSVKDPAQGQSPSLDPEDRVEVILSYPQNPVTGLALGRPVAGRVAGKEVLWHVRETHFGTGSAGLRYETTIVSSGWQGHGWNFDVYVTIYAVSKQNAVLFLRSLAALDIQE